MGGLGKLTIGGCSSAEFQLDCGEGLASCGAPDAHHHSACQSHRHFPTRQSDDGVLLDADQRRGLHAKSLLDRFRHHDVTIHCLFGILWNLQ